MLFDRKTHLNYDICSQKHLFPIILFRFFLSADKRTTRGGLNIRFPYPLLYHFIFVIMLSVVKYYVTLVRIDQSCLLVPRCHGHP